LSITGACTGDKKQAAPVPLQFKRFWSAPFPWRFVLPAACVLWVQVGAWTLLSIKNLNGEDQLPLHLPRDQSIWLSFFLFFLLLPFPERLIEQSSEKEWLSY
jgi:membrane protease YdiL (CAAX protease family)